MGEGLGVMTAEQTSHDIEPGCPGNEYLLAAALRGIDSYRLPK